jgi:hypothetical protein
VVAGSAPAWATSSSARRAAAWRRDGTDGNSRPPNTDISAGASVIDTAIAVSTVRASAGPNSRSTSFLATMSDAVLAATMSPAAAMIGANSAVASRAAGSRPTPSASLARMPDRKNTE